MFESPRSSCCLFPGAGMFGTLSFDVVLYRTAVRFKAFRCLCFDVVAFSIAAAHHQLDFFPRRGIRPGECTCFRLGFQPASCLLLDACRFRKATGKDYNGC